MRSKPRNPAANDQASWSRGGPRRVTGRKSPARAGRSRSVVSAPARAERHSMGARHRQSQRNRVSRSRWFEALILPREMPELVAGSEAERDSWCWIDTPPGDETRSSAGVLARHPASPKRRTSARPARSGRPFGRRHVIDDPPYPVPGCLWIWFLRPGDHGALMHQKAFRRVPGCCASRPQPRQRRRAERSAPLPAARRAYRACCSRRVQSWRLPPGPATPRRPRAASSPGWRLRRRPANPLSPRTRVLTGFRGAGSPRTLQSQPDALAKPNDASQVWSDSPRGHRSIRWSAKDRLDVARIPDLDLSHVGLHHGLALGERSRCPREAPRARWDLGRSPDSPIPPRQDPSAWPRAKSARRTTPRFVGCRPPRGASPPRRLGSNGPTPPESCGSAPPPPRALVSARAAVSS